MVAKIALVTPIYYTPLGYLEVCLKSVLPWFRSSPYGVELDWALVIDGDERPLEEFVGRICHDMGTPSPTLLRLSAHRGLGAARNAACSSVGADYYGWLDADDAMISSEYLEFVRISSPQFNSKKRLFVSDSYDCDERLGSRIRRRKQILVDMHCSGKGSNRDPLAFVDFIYQCQLVHEPSFAMLGGFSESILGEDVDLVLRLSELDSAPNIVHVPVAPYLYRHNPSGICETQWTLLQRSMEAAYSRHAQHWARQKVDFWYAGHGVITENGSLSLMPAHFHTGVCGFDTYLPLSNDLDLLPAFVKTAPSRGVSVPGSGVATGRKLPDSSG